MQLEKSKFRFSKLSPRLEQEKYSSADYHQSRNLRHTDSKKAAQTLLDNEASEVRHFNGR